MPNDTKLYEAVLETETLYKGRVLELEKKRVRLPDGKESIREIIVHHGGAAILALTDDQDIILVRQYRLASAQVLTEIPAGKLEKDEDPFVCAQRELEEETGFSAEHWEVLGRMYPSPGYTSECLYLYLARNLKPGKAHLDPGEFLDSFRLPFKEAVRQVVEGKIIDAKTCLAIMLANEKIRGEQ